LLQRQNHCSRMRRKAWFGTLAQLVEQRTFNPLVTSSNLVRPTKTQQNRALAAIVKIAASLLSGLVTVW
jgi:hypothetical protein